MLAQAMKNAKPTNVQLGNPSCDRSYTMRNNCTCSPLEDAFGGGLGAGLGSGNFKFLEIKLSCMWHVACVHGSM